MPYNSVRMAVIETPRGKVVSVLRDSEGARVIVDVEAGAICPRCAEGKGCGAGIFGSSASMRRVEATLSPGTDVSEGDTVSLSLGSRYLLQAATIVYGWPLLGAIAGALLAYFSNLGDAGAAVLALLGLAAGAILARIRLGHRNCLTRFAPQVTPLMGRPES